MQRVRTWRSSSFITWVYSNTSSFQLIVNNKRIIMEVDTGAAVSLISYKTYQKLFASVPLEKSTIKLSTFAAESIPVI